MHIYTYMMSGILCKHTSQPHGHVCLIYCAAQSIVCSHSRGSYWGGGHSTEVWSRPQPGNQGIGTDVLFHLLRVYLLHVSTLSYPVLSTVNMLNNYKLHTCWV